MKCLVRFGNECEVYSHSSVITLRNVELTSSSTHLNKEQQPNMRRICGKRLHDMDITNDTTAMLTVVDDDDNVIREYHFNEAIRTNKSVIVFIGNDYHKNFCRLITIAMHLSDDSERIAVNNPIDDNIYAHDEADSFTACVNDYESIEPVLIEIMSDNLTDNICQIAQGRNAYIEIM